MNSLEMIDKHNAEATLTAAESQRRAGNFVVVSYDGLHVLGFSMFATADEAFAYLNAEKTTAGPSQHFKMLLPADNWTPAADIDIEPGANSVSLPEGVGRGVKCTDEEEGAILTAIGKRDRATAAMQAAAFAFAAAQQECTAIAERMKARVLAEHAMKAN